MVNAVPVPEWLERMPMAPQFYPTETEFADPIAYISKIEKEASAFGICKIIPPIPKPSKKFVFDNLNKSLLKRPEVVNSRGGNGSNLSKSGGEENVEEARAVFTTRQQEVGFCTKKTRGVGSATQPSAKKHVWQSGEVYTLEQFEAKAKAFSREVLGKVEDVSPLVVETLFWKASSEKPIYVEYANDVPGSAFSEPIGPVRSINTHKARGRRLFTQNKCVRSDDEHKVVPRNHGREGTAGYKLSNSAWNLQVISRSAGSLTRFMLDDIPGVTSPMIYIGMLYSWFAWHVEDHELHSLNYLHIGSSKTWYAVPGEHAFAFEQVIQNETYVDDKDTLAALAILGEKTTIVSPDVFTRRGIPCCRLVQYPGEFVVTFPRAYHIGFSHGFNCGEAANFATPEWLNVAKEAAVRRTIMDHLPMLSHQQLLYHLTMSFVSRIPISLLPGIRSSRLRNRQKEAREILVKRAFVGDVLESDNLVNDLLKKDSSFRAVLWNSYSLLPFSGESISPTEVSADTARSENDRPAICLKDENDQINLYDQITLHMQMMDDLDIIDLSSDFEISSGALPCVACGILGFPYMCVVQPSSKASKEILRANNEALQSRKPKPTNISDDSISARAVASDEGWNSSCGFLRPRIFCLEHAIQAEELLRPKGGVNILVLCHSDFQKIKPTALVIAEEMGSTFGYRELTLDLASTQDLSLINLAIDDGPVEDWTSKLGINLKHLVKGRNKSAARPMDHKLKLCGLFSGTTPMPEPDMSKIRWSCRKSRRKRKPTCQEHAKSGGIVHEKREEAVQEKEENLKLCGLVDTERKNAPMRNLDNCTQRKLDVCFHYTRRRYRSKSGEAGVRSSMDSLIKHPRDSLNNVGATSSLSSVPASVESCILTEHDYQQSSVETAVGYGSSQITKCSRKESKAGVEGIAQTSETSEVSDAGNSCLYAIVSPESWKNVESGNSCRDEVTKVIKPQGPHSGANKEDTAKNNISDDPEHTISFVAETTSDISLHQAPMNIDLAEKVGPKKDLSSHSDLAENASECSKEDHETDSMHLGILASACLVNRQSEKIDAKTAPRNKKRGQRELILLDNNLNHDGFVKSPCEGLRPRIRKEETTKAAEEPPSKKKKASEIPASGKKTPNGTYRCSHEGCGKKFSSHSKFVDHQSVHEREQSFECTFKGCKMGFDSESARAEHVQTHMGTRPYQCEFEGCGLAFRYLSELGRHRRGTGHYTVSAAGV